MSILAAFMVPHPPMIVPAIGAGREADIQETIDAYEQVAEEIILFHLFPAKRINEDEYFYH